MSLLEGNQMTQSPSQNLAEIDKIYEEEISPIFMIDEPITQDSSIIGYDYGHILDDTGNKVNSTESNLLFKTNLSGKLIYPSDSYLRIIYKITDPEGKDIDEDIDVCLQNNGFSLFSSAQIKEAAGSVLESKQGYSGLIGAGATVMKLLRETPDEIDNTSDMEYFYLDEKDPTKFCPNVTAQIKNPTIKVNKGDPADPDPNNWTWEIEDADIEIDEHDNDDSPDKDPLSQVPINYKPGALAHSSMYTKGLRKRIEKNKKSKYVLMMLPLRKLFGLFYDVNKVFFNLQFELQLALESNLNNVLQIRRNDKFKDVNNTPYSTSDFRVFIKDIKWIMPTVTPSEAPRLYINEKIANNSKLGYTYSDWTIKRSDLFRANETNVSFSFTSHYKPLRLFILPMTKSRFDGRKYAKQENPNPENPAHYHKCQGIYESNTCFDTINLKSISCTLNGQDLDHKLYKDLLLSQDAIDNSGHPGPIDYMDLYKAWLEASFAEKGDIANAVSYESFRDSYPIISYDFTRLDPYYFKSHSNHQILIQASMNENKFENYDQDKNFDDGDFYFVCILMSQRYFQVQLNDSRGVLLAK